eukprot:scaffold178357_cov14-Tisochrysis_lutea.AAC.1
MTWVVCEKLPHARVGDVSGKVIDQRHQTSGAESLIAQLPVAFVLSVHSKRINLSALGALVTRFHLDWRHLPCNEFYSSSHLKFPAQACRGHPSLSG